MSHPSAPSRASPRWSSPEIGGSSQVVRSAAAIAGLDACRDIVSVGPPLFARGLRPGLGTPTWSPLVPLTRVSQPLPSPIRLWPPGPSVMRTTPPVGDWQSGEAVLAVLPATMVLLSSTVAPASTPIPPPLCAWLPEIVELMTLALPKSTFSPPPRMTLPPLCPLSASVLLATVTNGAWGVVEPGAVLDWIPPPAPPTKLGLSEIVVSSTVRCAEPSSGDRFATAGPEVEPLTVSPRRVRVPRLVTFGPQGKSVSPTSQARVTPSMFTEAPPGTLTGPGVGETSTATVR